MDREVHTSSTTCIVAFGQADGLGYRSAFDDGFDAVEDGYRLEIVTNPDRSA